MPVQKRNYHWRSKQIGFSRSDEAAFSRALRNVFDRVIIVDTTKIRGVLFGKATVPTPADLETHTFDRSYNLRPEAWVVDEDWDCDLLLTRQGRAIIQSRNRNPTSLNAHIILGRSYHSFNDENGKLAYPVPTLQVGDVSVGFTARHPDARKFVNSVWRALRMVSTNKLRTMAYQELYGGPRDVEPNTWVGFDALRWANLEPERTACGPLKARESWRFPDNSPLYEGLPIASPEWDRENDRLPKIVYNELV